MRYCTDMTITFIVRHDDPSGDDITEDMIDEALQRRADDLRRRNAFTEACEPLHTYEDH